MRFSKGARVTYSGEGIAVLRPRKPQRLGTVVGKSGIEGCVVVLWDGRKYCQFIHEDFLLLATKKGGARG